MCIGNQASYKRRSAMIASPNEWILWEATLFLYAKRLGRISTGICG